MSRQAPLPDVGGGNAGKLLDLGRHEASGGQGNQFVVFLNDFWRAVCRLHHHGGKFDDLVPAVCKACGLRIEEHQTVIFGKQLLKVGHSLSPVCMMIWDSGSLFPAQSCRASALARASLLRSSGTSPNSSARAAAKASAAASLPSFSSTSTSAKGCSRRPPVTAP